MKNVGVFDNLIENESRETGNIKTASVVTAIVQENWDEEHKGMVKVKYFMAELGTDVTTWVPVALPYTGNGYGMYFLPEIGTEVVIAFNTGNLECPIVIGSLWNGVNMLPEETANEKNTIKKIKTKAGHEIIFNEEEGKEQLEVHTAGGLVFLMEDEKKKISITDAEKKNGILLDGENGQISIEAEKKITLKAGGKEMVVLDGQGKNAQMQSDTVSVEASQSLTLKGQNTKIEGNMLHIKAQGSLKAESSGMAELKGSMVKIN